MEKYYKRGAGCFFKGRKACINKAVVLIILLYCKMAVLAQPNIKKLEYYIDADPGYGKAQNVAITAGKDLANIAINVDISALSQGVHIVGIRSADSTGAWSIDKRLLFLKKYASPTLAATPKITRIEYYIDGDPGYGKGAALPFTPATNIGIASSVSIAALSQGVHILGIRSQDSLGAWSFDDRMLFLKPYALPALGKAPKIKRVEYYLDNDPGYGNAINIPLNAGSDLSLASTISLAPLAEGVHILSVRSQDSLGAWSKDSRLLFLKKYTPPSYVAGAKIEYLEYYFDKDPGYGNATSIPVTAGGSVGVTSSLSIASLAEGVHILGVRSRDSLGAWSLDQRYLFLKKYTLPTLGAVPKLTRIEYYFDKDPGYGNGKPISFGTTTNIALAPAISLSSISEGIHKLFIRSQDSLGGWSLDQQLLFLKAYTPAVVPVPKITHVEYYFDKDPGYGKATAIPLTPATSLNLTADLTTPAAALNPGVHILGVRSQDSLGAWSLDNRWLFLKNYFYLADFSPGKIRLVEYYIDKDPGHGKATAVTSTHGTDVSTSFNVNISTLTAGLHFIGVRSLDSSKQWSLDKEYSFTVKAGGLTKTIQSVGEEGSAEATAANSLKLQFNPVRGQAILLYNAISDDRINIRVIDMAGNVITSKETNVSRGLNHITLETTMLSQGMYMVHTTGTSDRFSVKMLKQ